MSYSDSKPLQKLTRLYGIQTSYQDVSGKIQTASPEILLAVLKAMGVKISGLQDIKRAIRQRQLADWGKAIEPVIVTWDKKPFAIPLRLLSEKARGMLRISLQLENGETKQWQASLSALSSIDEINVSGRKFRAKMMQLPALPYGYHKLEIAAGDKDWEALIISSPSQAFQPESFTKEWGIFVPLYALHSRESLGSGDFSDLKELADWIESSGGDIIATLPLLAGFLDNPFEYSPYLPASRLFWNEFYLDVQQISEFKNCQPTRNILSSGNEQQTLQRLRASSLVDYKTVLALKRKILVKLEQYFFTDDGIDQSEFLNFVKTKPEIESYARFRAVLERQKKPWPSWSPRLQTGGLKKGDFAEENYLYHLYVQWQAHLQLNEIAESMPTARLCLDFPLGVHPFSFDTWRFQTQFVPEVDSGAPPDAFFTKGQNWRFTPLNPESIRLNHYNYLRACLQNVMQYASYLRIDHVMWLDRLFWIPKGATPPEGMYVRYPAEELYALFCLESHRHKCVLIGEDLGTVPDSVRQNMGRHKILRTFVGQFENWQRTKSVKRIIPKDSVVSLNTHDMPTFAGFWRGADLVERRKMGLLDHRSFQEDKKVRLTVKNNLLKFLRKEGQLKPGTSLFDILRACLNFLSKSSARILLINLEDLWLETRPQNIPGTGRERPNWRRKARYRLEQFSKMKKVTQLLKSVDSLRKH